MGHDEQSWADEITLCVEGMSTCGGCGEVVDQAQGFASAGHGFMCFCCHSEVLS